MSKYSVLLIDDEPIILQGLQILIDWEKNGFHIIGCASSGEEGLDMICELRPDIVISDINMPDISGIELISQACALCAGSQFIVLSGYSDFQYAKQCITLGVQEYLLKPVSETELLQTLFKVVKRIENDKTIDLKLSELKDTTQTLSILTMDEILRNISTSYFESEEDFFLTLQNYNLTLPEGSQYCSVSFKFTLSDDLKKLRLFIEQKLKEYNFNFLLFYYGNNILICIFSLPDLKQKFLEAITTLHIEVKDALDLELCIGIGNMYAHASSVTLSIKEALYALSYRIIRGTNSVNHYNDSLHNAYFIQSVPDDLWHKYEKSLLDNNFRDISTSISKIFQYMEKYSNLPILGMQLNSLYMIIIYLTRFSKTENMDALLEYANVDYMQRISLLNTSKELEKFTINIVSELIGSLPEYKPVKKNKLVIDIIKYVSTNYLEDISLSTVAQKFSVSPIYLSQIFKKQTGQLYLDYITQVKIEAAKKLLLTSDLMIYEISDLLHYRDSRYFSQLFEKKTGKKPSEYRNSSPIE